MKAKCAPPIVFVGISLPQSEASTLVSADIRPPIKRGDLDQVEAGAAAVIIDGELDPESRLQTDEIRDALRRGLTITGGASLGALRAHEAEGEGMRGAGWVYRAYRSGRIEGADEIAVVYDPGTYQPLTVPLVNVRFCLDLFRISGAISACEAEDAMRALRDLDPELRDKRAVEARLLDFFRSECLASALGKALARWDIKRCDAALLLRDIALRAERTA